MITYIDDLFLTDKTKKKIDKIKVAVEKETIFSRACLISLSKNTEDVFEITPIFILKLIKDKDIKVLGVAENKVAAIELCASITASVFNMKNDVAYSDDLLNKPYLREIIESIT